ncbi:MAG: PIN domain-containing protein [Planctomycetota bacterium]
MSEAKVFLDTNVLVYGMDNSAPRKRDTARDLLRRVGQANRGVISTQVLQECYVAGTGKLGVEPVVMKGILASLTHLEVVVVDPALIQDGIDCAILNQLSFWDGLIVAAAAIAECQTLWTEDLSAGQMINGVRVENPFTSRG